MLEVEKQSSQPGSIAIHSTISFMLVVLGENIRTYNMVSMSWLEQSGTGSVYSPNIGVFVSVHT